MMIGLLLRSQLTFLVLVVFLFSGAHVAFGDEVQSNAPNPEAVEQVVSGERTDANAAWWGFDPEDSTEFLQAAIDSGAKTVTVPRMDSEWIVRPIKLRSDLELVFEQGVVVLAKKGEFKGKGDSLFTATDASDIVVRGDGSTLRMRKADYQSDAYEKAEWRMALDFVGCSRVRVEALQLESSGGDGIYIGATEKQPYCEDVVIRNVICHDNHRQGISVISAVNLLIENCVMSNTDGTAPQAGIDLEPNNPSERMENCVIRNCIMTGNSGAGILIYLKPLSRESAPVSILFENCIVRGGEDTGIGVGAVSGPKGTIEFKNCVVEGAAKGGIYVYDKDPDSARLRFVNCVWKNCATGPGFKDKRSPLVLHLRRPEVAKKLGGIDFINCSVHDRFDRPALTVEEREGDFAVYDLQGEILVHNKHGATMEVGLKPVDVGLRVTEATP